MAVSLTVTHVAGRICASLVGGWVFVWGFATLFITTLVAAGQTYEEARIAAMLLAFLVFLAAFCWAFVAASLTRVWAVLAGGGALMTGIAWLAQRALV